MSPRAAWRLESLGFTQVFDYVAGKADWLANGLPTEGPDARLPRANDAARADVPTCGLDDRLGAVRARVEEAGWDECLIVNEQRVVLGRLRGEALSGSPEATAEQAMESGPTTVRPDGRLDELVARMRQQGVTRMVVTTSDGRLVGGLARRDAERLLDGGS